MSNTTDKPLLDVSVYEAKYTLRQEADGRLHALRYGEPWRNCVGDNLILQLGYAVEEARIRAAKLEIALQAIIDILDDSTADRWEQINAARKIAEEAIGHQ